jgi:hypothetical protein
MKKSITILFASTALTTPVALPVLGAVYTPHPATGSQPLKAVFDDGAQELPLVLASDDDHERHDDDDDDEDDDRYDDDDDDDEHHDEDDDDDDDDEGGRSPAPAGSVVPPDNGLFNSGAKPSVNRN